jgi:signal transduction histidine kinase
VSIIDAIRRFAKGDTQARATEQGPAEIREIAMAFNEMAASLERHREQQLAFIGGVAHDLRTPLQILDTGVALLDRPPSDRADVRDRIRRQIERLSIMIDDLLDRTRIEAGRLELHREPCDLRALVGRVIDMQRESAPARPFRLLLPHEPVSVPCDPPRIEQVVNNLLTNALKYSAESSEVEIVLERHDEAAVLSVKDQGIGIPASDRDKVFEAFRRGRNVGDIGGSGLGLSVTRKIVEAHGGSVGVSSELGSGSTFSVRLPLVSDQETPRAAGTRSSRIDQTLAISTKKHSDNADTEPAARTSPVS